MRALVLFNFFVLVLWGQDLDPQRHRTPMMFLDPPFEALLTETDASAVLKCSGALKELLHRYLVEGEEAFELASHEMLQGGTYRDFFLVQENRIVVDYTVVGDLTPALLALKEMDTVTVLAHASAPTYHVISALVSLDGLLPSVRLAGVVNAFAVAAQTGRVPAKGSTRSRGDADNQAETALDVDDLRRVLPSADGSSIRVGTLSDSADQVGGGINDSQSSDDLPDDQHVAVLSDWVDPDATDEGRAMMEHIYDMAPAVERLGFATAFGGVASFASNIDQLRINGYHVINDDVINFNEPVFQDGVVAQAVENHVNQGGVYFALNHNFANLCYEGVFRDDDNDGWHEYEPGDELMNFTALANSNISFGLQWVQPWGNATTDLQIDVYDNTSTLRWSSSDANIGGNPLDLSGISVGGSNLSWFFGIRDNTGNADGRRFKLFVYDNGARRATLPDYPGNATGTLTPHAGTGLSIAIGAAPFFSRSVAEDFSGHGPFKHYFNDAGLMYLMPVTFTKPDFLGIDGCNTTFFGRDIDEDADALPNFFGTSAATPNVAAIAAIMLDLAGGPQSLTAEEIREYLRMSAMDLGTVGHDTVYGYGRVNALGAGLLAKGPGTVESTIYLNQFGDATVPGNFYSQVDIDVFELASNTSGIVSMDFPEIHVDMDPMAILYGSAAERLTLDYDSGSGDDARVSYWLVGGNRYVLQTTSEEPFTGGADFEVVINGPSQGAVDLTAFLNQNGEVSRSDSLDSEGDAHFWEVRSPDYCQGRFTVTSQDFNIMLRVYDGQGTLLGNRAVVSGTQGNLEIDYLLAGERYAIQVVPNSYSGFGAYSLQMTFDGLDRDVFSAWRRPDRNLCGTSAPHIRHYIEAFNRQGCP